MEKTFEELLASMLADLDNGKSVEDIVATKMKEANLSEESKTTVEEAVSCVDKLDEARKKLQEATSKGMSRQEWLDSQIEKRMEALPEELKDSAKDVLDKVSKQYFENLDK